MFPVTASLGLHNLQERGNLLREGNRHIQIDAASLCTGHGYPLKGMIYVKMRHNELNNVGQGVIIAGMHKTCLQLIWDHI